MISLVAVSHKPPVGASPAGGIVPVAACGLKLACGRFTPYPLVLPTHATAYIRSCPCQLELTAMHAPQFSAPKSSAAGRGRLPVAGLGVLEALIRVDLANLVDLVAPHELGVSLGRGCLHLRDFGPVVIPASANQRARWCRSQGCLELWARGAERWVGVNGGRSGG